MFARGTAGILLVFALNNKRSHLNLRNWVAEIEAAEKARGGVFDYEAGVSGGHGRTSGGSAVRLRGRGHSSGDALSGGAGLADVPVLLVGNKSDQAHDGSMSVPLDGLEFCNKMEMSALDPESVPWDAWSKFIASMCSTSS